MRAQSGEHLFGGNGAARIDPHRVINADHFLPQPFLNGEVALLQRTQTRAYHLAAGGMGTRRNHAINKARLFGG